jgi:hypothetical protein
MIRHLLSIPSRLVEPRLMNLSYDDGTELRFMTRMLGFAQATSITCELELEHLCSTIQGRGAQTFITGGY